MWAALARCAQASCVSKYKLNSEAVAIHFGMSHATEPVMVQAASFSGTVPLVGLKEHAPVVGSAKANLNPLVSAVGSIPTYERLNVLRTEKEKEKKWHDIYI